MAPTNRENEMTDNEQAINEIIMDQLGLEEPIEGSDRLEYELGADSLDLIEMLMRLEEHFSIVVEDDAAEKLKTVNDVYVYVAENVKTRG